MAAVIYEGSSHAHEYAGETASRYVVPVHKHLRAHVRDSGLIYIPEVGKASGLEPEEFHRALLQLSREGKVELRADRPSDVPPADRKWCPAGPYGSLLVWARLTSEARDDDHAGYHGRHGARENPVPEGHTCSACTPRMAVVRSDAYEECLKRAATLGPLKTTASVYEVVHASVDTQEQEVLVVVPLDSRFQLKGGVIEVHKGAVDRVEVSTASVLRAVIVSGATKYIVVHNHPSGQATPSRADKALTSHLEKATKALGGEIVFLDHIVIGRNEYFSIRENKLYRVGGSSRGSRKR